MWKFLNYIVEDLQVLNLYGENAYITGEGHFDGDIYCSNLYSSGNIRGSNLIATTDLTTPILNVTTVDATNVNSQTLSVSGNANIVGNVTCQDINARHAILSGNLTLSNGNGSINGNLTVSGTINGVLNGNSSTATKLQTPRTFNLSSDVTIASPLSFDGTTNIDFVTKVVKIQNKDVSVITYGGIETLKINVGWQATRVYNAVYNDYAECFEIEKSNINYNNRIVQINRYGRAELASKKSNTVIGVVSDSYGMLLNGTDQDVADGIKVPVGMSGTVYVLTNEKLLLDSIGKLVYSDDNGYALTLDNNNTNEYNGSIVGKVIGLHENKNMYKIIIMLK
jgi:cytoskeletal protein CcmA (bactofilin family)